MVSSGWQERASHSPAVPPARKLIAGVVFFLSRGAMMSKKVGGRNGEEGGRRSDTGFY